MIKRNIAFILLSAMVIVGFILRFYQLTSFPVGFHLDEASKGYSAYSLLKTGRDDNNNFLPLYIDIFGDNSPAGYHYTTIPFVALFGLTEFAVRAPGAIFGILTIIALYFLVYSIFHDKKLSIVSSFLLAISPWHINLSRASSEANIALFFIIAGFAAIMWSIKKESYKFSIIGTILLIISFLFYQTPRLFVPAFFFLLLFFLFFFWKEEISKKFKKILIGCFIFVILVNAILIFVVKGGTGRLTQVNIFSYPETQLSMDEQIREDGVAKTNIVATRFFHNKAVNFSLAYISNYLEYFSWNFLFIKGLPNWYFVPSMGVTYLVGLPFFLYGILLLAFQKVKKYKVILLWLFLGPIAAAAAVDINNLQRAIVMFPMIDVIIAFGIVQLFQSAKRKNYIIASLIFVLFFVNSLYLLHQYFIHTKVHRTWYRYNGSSEMIKTVKNSYNSYDKIVVTKSTGGIYPLIQFYMQYDPAVYQKEGSPKDKPNSGFGKFYFVSEDCPSIKRRNSNDSPKTIYINRGTCKIDKKHPEKIIYREDNTAAFRVVYADTINPNYSPLEDIEASASAR